MTNKENFYLIIIIVNILYALFEWSTFFKSLRQANPLARQVDLVFYCILSFIVLLIIGFELRQKLYKLPLNLGLLGSFLLLTSAKLWTLLKIL